MNDIILIALISSAAALTGALLGSIPSFLQYKLRKEELKQKKIEFLHMQSIELIKLYKERVELLKLNKGVYSTLDPPLYLYLKFIKALKSNEDNLELSDDLLKYIKDEFIAIGKNPADYGL